MKQQIKKCYIGELSCNPDAGCVAVVAHNYDEGRAFVRNSEFTEACGCCNPFICVRVRLSKGTKVDDLPLDEIDHEEALKREIYAYLTDWDCEVCNKNRSQVYWFEEHGKIMCQECELTFNNKENE